MSTPGPRLSASHCLDAAPTSDSDDRWCSPREATRGTAGHSLTASKRRRSNSSSSRSIPATTSSALGIRGHDPASTATVGAPRRGRRSASNPPGRTASRGVSEDRRRGPAEPCECRNCAETRSNCRRESCRTGRAGRTRCGRRRHETAPPRRPDRAPSRRCRRRPHPSPAQQATPHRRPHRSRDRGPCRVAAQRPPRRGGR